MRTKLLAAGPASASVRYLFSHGAGAGMETPFMQAVTNLLTERGVASFRFEFAYMTARRETGVKRPPPRAERLVDEVRSAVAAMPPGPRPLIGGKSMGGRVASLVADDLYAQGQIAGLVCLGYPFHPPNRPEQLRTAHLEGLKCPTLIVQGERDPFGSRAEIKAMPLSPAIRFHWAADGDHDLGPRGASGYTRKANLAAAADAIVDFAQSLA